MRLQAFILATLVVQPSQGAAAHDELALARSVIEGLSGELAEEFAEQLRMEASRQDDFRAGLQAYLLKDLPRDPGAWPLADEPPLYDPERHCPAQPIPRKRLRVDDPRSVKALEALGLSNADPHVAPGWVYDYPSRELRRTAHWDSHKRILLNGLLGAPPDQDLATAILEKNLDNGELRASFEAFAHGYSDRKGNVYPGVTLYDAWASGSQMEMPDVECLGIVHDLLDDWRTWKAPVRKQEPLYDAISELFFPVRQYRGLRHALAISYLVGERGALGDYASNQIQLQALWEECASTPPTLMKRLPVAKDWRAFLEDWRTHVTDTPDLQRKAQVRASSLVGSAAKTQALMLGILRENELLPE